MPTPIRSGTFHDDGSLELWPPTETGKAPMNGRDLPRALVTDLTPDELALAQQCQAMLGNVYDRLAKVANDSALAAAYDAHPELGKVVESQALALAQANARLVELGEKPVSMPADAKAIDAESPSQAAK